MLLYVILAFIKVASRLLTAFFIQIIQSKISTILLKLNHRHPPDLCYKKVKKIFMFVSLAIIGFGEKVMDFLPIKHIFNVLTIFYFYKK